MTTTQKCEFCEKEGYPILLARYSVAPEKDTSVPAELRLGFGVKLSGNLKSPISADLGAKAHYTARLLRTGYVYVYDQARDRWATYFVTQNGCYIQLPEIGPNQKVMKLPDNFACSRDSKPAMGHMITIRDPKNASKVWVGFSDVLWTEDVFKKNQSETERAKHMRLITFSGGKANDSAAHCAPIMQLDSAISEFAVKDFHATRDYGRWSPYVFNSRFMQSDDLKRAVQQLRPQDSAGVIVCLDDPVGMTVELACLMATRMKNFTDHPERARPLAISTTIVATRDAVRNQAELERVKKNLDARSNPRGGFSVAALKPDQLKEAAEKEWGKYTHTRNGALRYDEAERAKFQAKFDTELGEFDKAVISPLAKTHVAWFGSQLAADYFESNFDKKDADQNAAYTAIVTQMMAGTADKKDCFDLYYTWLNSNDTENTRNLLLRAMVLNNNDVAKAIKQATSSNVDLRSMPWDNLFDSFKTAVEEVAGGNKGMQAIGPLLAWITGPLSKVAMNMLDSKAATATAGLAAMTLLGVYQKKPLVKVTTNGTMAQFRELIVRQILQANPDLKGYSLNTAVKLELERMRINGATLTGPWRQNFLVFVDPTIVRNLPQADTPTQIRHVMSSLQQFEMVRDLNWLEWRSRLHNAGQPLSLGLTIGALQVWNLTKLIDDHVNAMSHEAVENKNRMWAGVANVSATVMETVGEAMKRMARTAIQGARGLLSVLAKTLASLGRLGGLVVGAIVAVMDGAKGVEMYRKRDYQLMLLYWFSAALGFGCAVGFFFAGALSVKLLLVLAVMAVLYLVVAWIIEAIKDNKMQEWIHRCYFGTHADKYRDLSYEKTQLELASKE